MTDQIEEDPKPPKSEPKTPSLAKTEGKPKLLETFKSKKPNVSFRLWPPSQRTRDSVVRRLVKSLSTRAILSRRYSLIPEAEAGDIARRIEEEAFATANATASGDDNGVEIFRCYSKEFGKRMLETVKSRSGGTSSDSAAEGDAAAGTTSEDVKSEKTETD